MITLTCDRISLRLLAFPNTVFGPRRQVNRSADQHLTAALRLISSNCPAVVVKTNDNARRKEIRKRFLVITTVDGRSPGSVERGAVPVFQRISNAFFFSNLGTSVRASTEDFSVAEH